MWICVAFFAISGSEEVTLWYLRDTICEAELYHFVVQTRIYSRIFNINPHWIS